MMNTEQEIVTPEQIRNRVRTLQKRFGRPDWLTVVGGVTAEAYRAAGMSGEEFAELMHFETSRNGELNFSLRRKANMRLRKGFDGQWGSIKLVDGFAHLQLSYVTGSYTDAEPIAEIVISGSKVLRSSLLVVGGLNRPLGLLGVRGLPSCVERGAGRVLGITQQHFFWGSNTKIAIAGRYETLGIMPSEVADDLGIEEQDGLGHIPWMSGYRAEPAVSRRADAGAVITAPVRARPALRVV